MTAPYCETCQDEPAFARCPDCGTIPLHILHDSCKEPLRQIAEDMCRKRSEQLTDIEQLKPREGRARIAA
jgi:hypothetical protein